jgi:hypothetical protein
MEECEICFQPYEINDNSHHISKLFFNSKYQFKCGHSTCLKCFKNIYKHIYKYNFSKCKCPFCRTQLNFDCPIKDIIYLIKSDLKNYKYLSYSKKLKIKICKILVNKIKVYYNDLKSLDLNFISNLIIVNYRKDFYKIRLIDKLF